MSERMQGTMSEYMIDNDLFFNTHNIYIYISENMSRCESHEVRCLFMFCVYCYSFVCIVFMTHVYAGVFHVCRLLCNNRAFEKNMVVLIWKPWPIDQKGTLKT